MSVQRDAIRFDYAYRCFPLAVSPVTSVCDITDARYAAACMRRHHCIMPVFAMSDAERHAIYREFYDVCGASQMPTRSLALVMYAVSWMLGTSNAVRALAHAVGQPERGYVTGIMRDRLDRSGNRATMPFIRAARIRLRRREYRAVASDYRSIMDVIVKYVSADVGDARQL